MINMRQKVALITGAAGGIGSETAKLFAQAGATVILTDFNLAHLTELKEQIEAITEHVVCSKLDCSDLEACQQLCSEVAKSTGGIDYVVHCAGVYPEKPVSEMDASDWQHVLNTNLNSTFFICQAAMPYLNANSVIVNLSSIAGHKGSQNHAHYSASKGGVSSFSKSLALELGPKTRVNCVAPGIISTTMTTQLIEKKGTNLIDQTPLQRFGTPTEVAGTILFLCSDLASFITGETIHVNGGLYMT